MAEKCESVATERYDTLTTASYCAASITGQACFNIDCKGKDYVHCTEGVTPTVGGILHYIQAEY